MAEVAGAYVAENVVEGAAATAYGVTRSTLPLKGRWQQVGADSPLPRSSHSLVVITGKAYIFGGEITPREPVDNHVHVYTLPSGVGEGTDYTTVEADDAPPPRVGHIAVAIGQYMYVFGGRGGKEMKPLDEAGRVWCFDTKTSSWSAIDPADAAGPRPEARSYHASAATEIPLPNKLLVEADPVVAATRQHGTIFVHGGCPVSGRVADVWAFDIATRTWRQLPDAPGAPRGGSALTFASNRLYRFGGFDGKDEVGGQVDVLEFGDEALTEGQWTSVKMEKDDDDQFPGNRSVSALHHVTTGLGRNYLVLLLGEKTPSGSGHDAAGSFWDDVWAFQIQPDSKSGASIKDATRRLVGMKTNKHRWAEVQVPEASMSDGRVEMPGARGWFASSGTGDLDKTGVVLWGGINSKNERLTDGYLFTVEAA